MKKRIAIILLLIFSSFANAENCKDEKIMFVYKNKVIGSITVEQFGELSEAMQKQNEKKKEKK